MTKNIEDAPEAPQVEEAEKKFDFEWNDRLDAIARGENPDAEADEDEPIEDSAEEVDEDPEAADEVPDEVPAEASKGDWINPDVAALGKAYGLSLTDLENFESREELDRAISFWERQQPKSEKKEEKKTDGELKEIDENGFINPEYYEKNDFDDATLALVKSLRATQEEAASFKAYTAQVQQAQELNAFHDAVDAFDPEFYGVTVDDSGRPVNIEQAAADRRSAVLGEAYAVADRIARRQASAGQEVQLPPWRVLIQQADKILFGREREQAKKKDVAERVAVQSKKRRPVASTAATRPTARRKEPDPRNPAEIANDPDILRFMEKVGSKT